MLMDVRVREDKWIILDVDTRRQLGLKHKLICHFKLAADKVMGIIRELVNDTDQHSYKLS